MNTFDCLVKDQWGVWEEAEGKWTFNPNKRLNAKYPSDTLIIFKAYGKPKAEHKSAPLYGSSKYHILVQVPDKVHYPLLNSAPGLKVFNLFLEDSQTQLITWLQDTVGRHVTSWFMKNMEQFSINNSRDSYSIILWLWKHLQLCRSLSFPFSELESTAVILKYHPNCHRDTLEILNTGNLCKDHYVNPKTIEAATVAHRSWTMAIPYRAYLKEISIFRRNFDTLPGNGHLRHVFKILLLYNQHRDHQAKLLPHLNLCLPPLVH